MSLRERRKKRELAGELNRSAMRELGAGRQAGRRSRSAMKVGRRAEGRGRRGSYPVSLREKKNFEEERRKKKKPERERIGNSFLT